MPTYCFVLPKGQYHPGTHQTMTVMVTVTVTANRSRVLYPVIPETVGCDVQSPGLRDLIRPLSRKHDQCSYEGKYSMTQADRQIALVSLFSVISSYGRPHPHGL